MKNLKKDLNMIKNKITKTGKKKLMIVNMKMSKWMKESSKTCLYNKKAIQIINQTFDKFSSN